MGTRALDELWGSQIVSTSTCQSCETSAVRDTSNVLFSLQPPPTRILGDDARLRSFRFCDLVQSTLAFEQHTKIFCEKCREYKPTVHRKSAKTLPAVLAFNTNIDKDTEKSLWTKKQKLLVSSDDGDASWDDVKPLAGSTTASTTAGAADKKKVCRQPTTGVDGIRRFSISNSLP